MLTKQETLLGRGSWRAGGQGTQENCSALRFTVLALMVMGFLAKLSRVNLLTQSPFWCRTHYPAKLDSIKKDSGRLIGHVMFSFELSQIFPVDGGWLVTCSLSGSLVIK